MLGNLLKSLFPTMASQVLSPEEQLKALIESLYPKDQVVLDEKGKAILSILQPLKDNPSLFEENHTKWLEITIKFMDTFFKTYANENLEVHYDVLEIVCKAFNRIVESSRIYLHEPKSNELELETLFKFLMFFNITSRVANNRLMLMNYQFISELVLLLQCFNSHLKVKRFLDTIILRVCFFSSITCSFVLILFYFLKTCRK